MDDALRPVLESTLGYAYRVHTRLVLVPDTRTREFDGVPCNYESNRAKDCLVKPCLASSQTQANGPFKSRFDKLCLGPSSVYWNTREGSCQEVVLTMIYTLDQSIFGTCAE